MTLDILGYYSIGFADQVTVCIQRGDRGCKFTWDLIALLILRELAGQGVCDGEYCPAYKCSDEFCHLKRCPVRKIR